MPSSFIKDPDATLDYTVEWGEWLGDGDTVSTATWTVPDDLTAEDQATGTTSATVTVSGGTAGQTYALTCRVTTAAGLTDDRTIHITVRQR